MTTTLALHDGDFTRDQIQLIKDTICVGATDTELALFVQTAKRMRLDPFARQIFAVKRWNRQAGREVMSTQVSVDGFRLTAERTGKYAGQLGPLWTADGKDWVEVWLARDPPAAAKVGVMRHDFKEPVWAVATWDAYKQEGKSGLSPMWAKMGALMLAKCAECLALRRAFPNELSGIYSPEEMQQATTVEVVAEGPKASTAGVSTAAPAMLVTAPVQDPTGQATSKPARAPSVKHDGTFANHKQIAYLHMLKAKAGVTACKPEDCGIEVEQAPKKWGQPPRKVIQRCVYHTQLAAFRDCDGKPITTSKNLSEAQISNLIGRYETKVGKQEARASETPNIGSIGTADEQLEEIRSAIEEKGEEEAISDALCEVFRCTSIDLIPKHELPAALSLVLAWGTAAYPAIRERVRP